MLSFMRGNLNIHSAALESVVYVCKAWHFQHTINLIYHNTFHLSSIYHSLSPQDTVKPEEQEKLMWRHRSEVRRGRAGELCVPVTDVSGGEHNLQIAVETGRGLALTTHKEEQPSSSANTAPATMYNVTCSYTRHKVFCTIPGHSLHSLQSCCCNWPLAVLMLYSGDTLNSDKNYKWWMKKIQNV